MNETYEQAVERTGRRWPYRSKDWPCPACGNAECDLDVDLVYRNFHRSVCVYSHTTKALESVTGRQA